MVLFKINGERNSGTNFLRKILEQNGFPVTEQIQIDNVVTYMEDYISGITVVFPKETPPKHIKKMGDLK
jgi:hypothetical protein